MSLPWLRVSYSSLNTFNFCPRKFEFSKLWGQEKKRGYDDSIPAAVGRTFHEAYQHFIVSQDLDSAIWLLLKNYPWHLAAYDSYNKRTWDVCLTTFIAACERFSCSEYEIMRLCKPDGEKVDCVEVPFELRFLNTELPGYAGFAFTGFTDLILRSRLDQSIRSFDIKTHQDYAKDRSGEYQYNAQQIPYGIVVEHLLNKKIESFDVSYLDCFLSLTEPRVNEYRFTKDQTAIQEWLTARVLQFRQIKQMMELELFSRRESGCVAFRRKCHFLDICATRNQQTLKAWFDEIEDDVRDWEPWIVAEIDMGITL